MTGKKAGRMVKRIKAPNFIKTVYTGLRFEPLESHNAQRCVLPVFFLVDLLLW